MKSGLIARIQERYRLTAVEWALIACLVSIVAVGALDLLELMGAG